MTEGTKTVTPGELIRQELDKRGWSQEDLAHVLSRPPSVVSKIITGKQELSPEIAASLEAVFAVPATRWMQLESEYRLSLSQIDTSAIRDRTRLYELGPIVEMQKRGWLKASPDAEEFEKQVAEFFELDSIHDDPSIGGVMRKTAPTVKLTPDQQAWYFRIRHIARKINAMPFDEKKLPDCKAALRKLAAYSAESAKVAKVLSMYGIRFIVVQPLASGKIDGVATWLDEKTPVIGLSMRFERIDNFWFNVFHEFSHIVHKDESIDTDLFNRDDLLAPQSAIEARADADASAALIPPKEMDEFILLYGPLYSKEKINRFANKLKLHPGIIVGQLQHRGKIGFSANREMLVKVRDIVAPSAVTDGWGHTIDERN